MFEFAICIGYGNPENIYYFRIIFSIGCLTGQVNKHSFIDLLVEIKYALVETSIVIIIDIIFTFASNWCDIFHEISFRFLHQSPIIRS